MFSSRSYRWLWAATGALAAGVLLTSMARPVPTVLGAAASPAADDSSTPATTPYRGFTTPRLDTADLTDMATQWHANIVRYLMRPQQQAQNICHCTNMEAWQKIVHDLPEQLDTAKRLHIAVVITMMQVPVEHYPQGAEDREGLHAFWSDDNSLAVMTQAWADVAKICANRDQVIWFDLLNEPLDREDLPGYPRKWPAWAQSLIDSIRQIDQQHQIVVEPGPGGLVTGMRNFPKLRGDGIIYSIHDYLPGPYTMQGVSQMTNPDATLPSLSGWPGFYQGQMWNKQRILAALQPAIDFQRRNHVRIYVGEFSVARWIPDGSKWLRDNMDIFEQLGWDWTYHGFRESNIWSLEHTGDYHHPSNLAHTGQFSDRGQVLLQYLSRNQTQQ